VDFSEIKPVRITCVADGSTVTFDRTQAGGSAQVGLAVNLSASKTIQTAGDGERILGVLLNVEPDGMCTVQVGGVATFKGGTSATLTPGSAIVGDLLSAAEGYIQTVGTGSVAAGIAGRGMILDASDTNAVKVLL
jgi:hypothetical protein